MSRSMGEMIRELRKVNNITQEQLAEVLGVSFQSVSRWENGLSYPDITFIPVLARYFDVSTDTLFDMENDNWERSKEQYETDYKKYRRNGEVEKCYVIMKEALEQFPRNYHFAMNIAETMALYGTGTTQQQKQYMEGHYNTRIFQLCQRVLEECREESERNRAIYLLCDYYTQTGNTAEALQLIKSIADFEHCRDILLGNVLNGKEKVHQLQKNLLQVIDYAATTLVKMAFQKEYGIAETLTIEGRIQYVKTANALYELLLPDGNYQYYHRIVGWNHRRLCELYLLQKEISAAFEELEKAEYHAEKYDLLEDHQYTSIFVNSLQYHPEEYYKGWIGSERGMLLYRLKELESYFLENEDFNKMKKRLEEKTRSEMKVSIQ